ncbi:hypothetical protein CALVIDRAFT_526687 [Calocera viscosa TUFC12733]|uniref:Uncharacterized protein n=1 Tax=Calocera viscosa (strain TUFC12733) TaxID=1330018 RepID=A0A167NBS7_CALVF|nr:hypothetical protein CALVIDRAFT_526687 [Calocera viscosa TUFC12733]
MAPGSDARRVLRWYRAQLAEHVAATRGQLLGQLAPGDRDDDGDMDDEDVQDGPAGADERWTQEEQNALFPSLSRHTRYRPDLLAQVSSHSSAEVAAHLHALDEGAKLLVEDWERGDVPQCAEVGEAWGRLEEWAAERVLRGEEEGMGRKRGEAEWELRELADREEEGEEGEGEGRQTTRKRRHSELDEQEDSLPEARKTKRRRLIGGLAYDPPALRALQMLLPGYDLPPAPADEDQDEDQIEEYLRALSPLSRGQVKARLKVRKSWAAKKGKELDLRVGPLKGPVERAREKARRGEVRKEQKVRGLHSYEKWKGRLEACGVGELAEEEGLDLIKPKGIGELMVLYYNALWPDADIPTPQIQHSVLVLLAAHLRHWLTQTMHRVIVMANQEVFARSRTIVFPRGQSGQQGKNVWAEHVTQVLALAGDRPDSMRWWDDVATRLGVELDEEGLKLPKRKSLRMERYAAEEQEPTSERLPAFFPLELDVQPSTQHQTYLRTPSPSLLSEELNSEDELEEEDADDNKEAEEELWLAVGGKGVLGKLLRRNKTAAEARDGAVPARSQRQSAKFKSKGWIENSDELMRDAVPEEGEEEEEMDWEALDPSDGEESDEQHGETSEGEDESVVALPQVDRDASPDESEENDSSEEEGDDEPMAEAPTPAGDDKHDESDEDGSEEESDDEPAADPLRVNGRGAHTESGDDTSEQSEDEPIAKSLRINATGNQDESEEDESSEDESEEESQAKQNASDDDSEEEDGSDEESEEEPVAQPPPVHGSGVHDESDGDDASEDDSSHQDTAEEVRRPGVSLARAAPASDSRKDDSESDEGESSEQEEEVELASRRDVQQTGTSASGSSSDEDEEESDSPARPRTPTSSRAGLSFVDDARSSEEESEEGSMDGFIVGDDAAEPDESSEDDGGDDDDDAGDGGGNADGNDDDEDEHESDSDSED